MSRAALLALALYLCGACASSPVARDDAMLGVARNLIDGGLPEVALRQLEGLEAQSAEGWRLRGRCLDQLGEAGAAHVAYQRGIALDPTRADLRNDLGFSLLVAGEHARAREHLEGALLLDPELSIARTNLAAAFVLDAEEARAFTLLQVDRAPAEALADLGALLELAGDPVRARVRYRESIALDATQTTARENLARIEPEFDEGETP